MFSSGQLFCRFSTFPLFSGYKCDFLASCVSVAAQDNCMQRVTHPLKNGFPIILGGHSKLLCLEENNLNTIKITQNEKGQRSETKLHRNRLYKRDQNPARLQNLWKQNKKLMKLALQRFSRTFSFCTHLPLSSLLHFSILRPVFCKSHQELAIVFCFQPQATCLKPCRNWNRENRLN